MREIISKEIILYGTERYMKDFQYVFANMFNIIECISDNDKNIEQVSILCKEKGVYLVICQYDVIDTVKELTELELYRNKDYYLADSLFYLLDFPIREIAKRRSVYLWGIGERGHAFCHEFVEKYPDVEIAGHVDSSKEVQGKTWFRRPVYKPEEVINTNAFFVITSDDYYDEISNTLREASKVEGEDYIHYKAIGNRASWMMRETVYDRPRLDYVCYKPFKDAVLCSRGRLSVCAGIKGMENWGIPGYCGNFNSIWHSNIMKVLRLSIVNGTYTFCDKVKCNYLFETNQREIDLDELHYFTSRSEECLNEIAKKNYHKKDKIFNIDNYKIIEEKYPEVVFLSFDRTCNLHCPSCRNHVIAETGRQKQQMINFDNRLKKELYPYVKKLKVSGAGEVFASEVHQSTIFNEELAKKIKKIGILSNGTLFIPEKFEKLRALYEEINVFISMDGATKETAEKLRRGADFEKWKQNMEYLGEMRRKGYINFFSFNFVVQRDNYFEMADFAKMCLSFSADAIKFSKIYKSTTIGEEEFLKVSMFDNTDKMLPELEQVVSDDVFKEPQIHLFTWVDW